MLSSLFPHIMEQQRWHQSYICADIERVKAKDYRLIIILDQCIFIEKDFIYGLIIYIY